MNAHVPPIKADEGTVRTFLQIIHERAESALKGADRPGYLQLVAIHPTSKSTVANRFRIGDIDGMTHAALTFAERGLNVYAEARTIAEHALPKGRGELSDTCAVFAFVIDADADKGKGGTLPIEPSLTVETSPGNYHHWLFLDRALTAEQAKPIGDAIRAATGADADTGVITQPYRIAGTPNFPGPRKAARGRVATPTRIAACNGPIRTQETLVEAFPPPPKQERARTGSSGKARCAPSDYSAVEQLVSEVATPAMNRSARFQSAVNAAVRAGMPPDDLEHLMRQHPKGCASKYLEGRDRLQEEIKRSWVKADARRTESDTEAGEALDRLNEKYCVVCDGGKTRVLYFAQHVQGCHTRLIATFLSFEDFRNLYLNKTIQVVGPKPITLGHWWLKHPDRRQYDGLIFQPGQADEIDGCLNLWRGWGIEPQPGSWSLMRRHIVEVLAAGDEEAAEYVLNWIAWSFQNPAERAQAALEHF